jgi:hypothetical protein
MVRSLEGWGGARPKLDRHVHGCVEQNGRSVDVAHQGNSAGLVPLPDLTVSNADEIAALVAVLERKSILTQQEVVEEIKRLKAKTPKAR